MCEMNKISSAHDLPGNRELSNYNFTKKMPQLATCLGCLGIECHLCVCTCMHMHIYANSCACSHTSVGGESGSVSQKTSWKRHC